MKFERQIGAITYLGLTKGRYKYLVGDKGMMPMPNYGGNNRPNFEITPDYEEYVHNFDEEIRSNRKMTVKTAECKRESDIRANKFIKMLESRQKKVEAEYSASHDTIYAR